jgi:hypothetical protein
MSEETEIEARSDTHRTLQTYVKQLRLTLDWMPY